MREKLLALNELQNVDLEIATLKKAAESHPRRMAELEGELGAARAELEAVRGRLSEVEQQKSTLEQNIADEKEKLKKWEARLAEQRSTREYSALAREIDIARKANLNMADELTEISKNEAAVRAEVNAAAEALSARRDGIQGEIIELREKAAEADAQVKGLEDKRAVALKMVDPTLIRRYEAVRKRRFPALVTVDKGTCRGCNMNIRPQLYNQLVASGSTDICPSCGRIICAEETLAAPTAPAAE